MKRLQTTAHRGYSEIAPENTLISFRMAMEHNPDYVECDVHQTSDGEIVVMHDGSVDRTTDGSGQISGMDIDTIWRLDAGRWFHPDFAGEKVPLLSELLDLCRGKVKVMVEIKDEWVEENVYRLIGRAGMLDGVMIISFHHSVGVRLKSLDPEIPFARLIWSDHPIHGNEAEALADTLAAGNASILGLNYGATTQELVDVMHGHGMRVSVWTVDTADDILKMARLGVDIITSNDIVLLVKTLAEMK